MFCPRLSLLSSALAAGSHASPLCQTDALTAPACTPRERLGLARRMNTESPDDCWSHSQAREAGTYQDAALGAGYGLVFLTFRFSAWSLVQDINCQSSCGPGNTDSLVFMLSYQISGPFYKSHLVVSSVLAPCLQCESPCEAGSWPRLFYDLETQNLTSNHLQRRKESLINYAVFGCMLYRDHIQLISVGGVQIVL